MVLKLFLLFTIVPFVELYLLIKIGTEIGLLETLGLILLTGALGSWLAWHEGLRTMIRFQERMQQGELPTDQMIDGLLLLVAGAVLLTPGFLTDAMGFSLLLPPLRALIRGFLKNYLEKHMELHTLDPGSMGPGGPMDGFPPDPRDNSSRPPDVVLEKDSYKVDK